MRLTALRFLLRAYITYLIARERATIWEKMYLFDRTARTFPLKSLLPWWMSVLLNFMREFLYTYNIYRRSRKAWNGRRNSRLSGGRYYSWQHGHKIFKAQHFQRSCSSQEEASGKFWRWAYINLQSLMKRCSIYYNVLRILHVADLGWR